jgi:hypothetical protein
MQRLNDPGKDLNGFRRQKLQAPCCLATRGLRKSAIENMAPLKKTRNLRLSSWLTRQTSPQNAASPRRELV